STLLGLGAACWFATGLLGITLLDLAAVWENIKVVMVEAMSHTAPDWPMVIT
ncbi:YjcB family protein, partial [Enterobacter hormaechei]|uniref:YjcB family protein n=1 Tax=Enterobacter hormaechei TaxID=158836 RepID=UPI0023B78763